MKTLRQFVAALSFIFLTFSNCEGQNYIYGIHHNGGYYFSRYDISNNTYIDLQPLAIGSLSSAMSSCIDHINSIYYLYTGSTLLGFNLNSGTIVTNYVLPLPGIFNKIQFNSCDTNIYGLLNNASAIQLARIIPSAGTMNIVFSQTYNAGFCYGCLGFIDPATQVYTLHMGGAIIGIDLNNGQIVYNSTVINIGNENFGHVCLHCNTHTIYGTSADVSAGVKYLATIDPFTGIVSHVPGGTGWNTGVWKPASAGATIDQVNSMYYYIGAGNLLNGIDLFSGNLQFSQTIIPEMNFIQHVPQCSCESTGLDSYINDADFSISPNPFTEKLNITIDKNECAEINLYDVTGRRVAYQTFTKSTSISTKHFSEGIYVYEVRSKNGIVKKGKVVKE